MGLVQILDSDSAVGAGSFNPLVTAVQAADLVDTLSCRYSGAAYEHAGWTGRCATYSANHRWSNRAIPPTETFS